ncbi:MAG: hypothetical protein FWC93_06970 [Defluviitaleaceae bacterium]|nr:hypothetical protein [Defluviitaleaceae bacterium]
MGIYHSNRKVVLVKGDKNKGYEQAIFILRADGRESGIDFVREAERIINGQCSKIAEMPPAVAVHKKRAKSGPRFDIKLSLALAVAGAALLALFFFNFL